MEKKDKHRFAEQDAAKQLIALMTIARLTRARMFFLNNHKAISVLFCFDDQ